MKKLLYILLFISCLGFSQTYEIIWQHDFDTVSLGAYPSQAKWEAEFLTGNPDLGAMEYGYGTHLWVADSVDGVDGRSLILQNPANQYSPSNGGHQHQGLLDTSMAEAYLTYDVYFKENTDAHKGGKLWGVRGGYPWAACGDGFVSIIMFEKWSLYDTNAIWITSYSFDCNASYIVDEFNQFIGEPGMWYNFTIRYVMNTPGSSDGIIEHFVEGIKISSYSDYQFRGDGDDPMLDRSFFSYFYGGNDASYAPEVNEWISIDNAAIYGKMLTSEGYVDGLNVYDDHTYVPTPYHTDRSWYNIVNNQYIDLTGSRTEKETLAVLSTITGYSPISSQGVKMKMLDASNEEVTIRNDTVIYIEDTGVEPIDNDNPHWILYMAVDSTRIDTARVWFNVEAPSTYTLLKKGVDVSNTKKNGISKTFKQK